MPGKGFGHPDAVLRAGSRDGDQELHGRMRGDRTAAHLLLHALRKQLDQRQPARHPTWTAVKPMRQLVQPVAEALLQFG
jgi:hypothetical protein